MAGLFSFRIFLAALIAAGLVSPALSAAEAAPQADAASQTSQVSQFAAFKRNFRPVALADGIRGVVYDRAMARVRLRPKVTKHNLNQPEFVKTIWDYLDSALSDARVQEGRRLMVQHRRQLKRISARFGVPAPVLVAIWGMETRYGRIMGHHSIFSALTTLAYDGPRTGYARRQLLAALHIMQDQHLSPGKMQASWAGAFGQTQFVPTTFLSYAADGNGDGRIDLWDSWADALASAARLLTASGWQRGQSWGEEVVLPENFPWAEADLAIRKPVAAWRDMGVRGVRGPLSKRDEPAAIFLPAGTRGPAFLVRKNFGAILHYNHATAYALGVALLSERLRGRAVPRADWPRDEPPILREEVIAMQSGLNVLGYNAGKPDGLIGPGTRAALRRWQEMQGLRADGFATQALVRRICAASGVKVQPPAE